MKILNKSKKEIINDKKINNSFLSTKFLNINCKIYKGNFYSDSFNYFPITEKYEAFKGFFRWQVNDSLEHFFSDEMFEFIIQNKNNFKKIEDVFLLGSSAGDSYYSNLLHFLPRIFFNQKKEVKIAIHRNTSNNFRTLIKKICLKNKVKIKFVYLDDGFYYFHNSQIPQFLKIADTINLLNYYFKNFLFNKNIKNDNTNNQKIYISRQNSSYRNVVNEDDIIKLLKKNNFTIIDPNNLTMKQMIKFFYNAKTIISPNGSILTNLIFCNPGVKILEIAPSYEKNYEQNLNDQYKNLCQIVGLNYTKIIADTVKIKKHDSLAKKYIHKKILEDSSHYCDLIIKVKDIENFIN